MIAKLITYGKDRDEAIELMKKALSDYRVKIILFRWSAFQTTWNF